MQTYTRRVVEPLFSDAPAVGRPSTWTVHDESDPVTPLHTADHLEFRKALITHFTVARKKNELTWKVPNPKKTTDFKMPFPDMCEVSEGGDSVGTQVK